MLLRKRYYNFDVVSNRIPNTRSIARTERGFNAGLHHSMETLGIDAAKRGVLLPLPSACPGCERGIRGAENHWFGRRCDDLGSGCDP